MRVSRRATSRFFSEGDSPGSFLLHSGQMVRNKDDFGGLFSEGRNFFKDEQKFTKDQALKWLRFTDVRFIDGSEII